MQSSNGLYYSPDFTKRSDTLVQIFLRMTLSWQSTGLEFMSLTIKNKSCWNFHFQKLHTSEQKKATKFSEALSLSPQFELGKNLLSKVQIRKILRIWLTFSWKG
jgi:hypothetical protein